jgi:hypothetical protein
VPDQNAPAGGAWRLAAGPLPDQNTLAGNAWRLAAGPLPDQNTLVCKAWRLAGHLPPSPEHPLGLDAGARCGR